MSTIKIHEATAVSYTHLRAHETVLDLVCRLLLEKKKNNKKNKYISKPPKPHRNTQAKDNITQKSTESTQSQATE